MTLKQVLMFGSAICCVVAVPARAGTRPVIHVLGPRGATFVKSAMHHRDSGTITQTFSATTEISTSADYKVKTPVAFFDVATSTICALPSEVKYHVSPHKTAYARIAAATMTISEGCPKGPVTLYGATYELTTRHAIGKTDHFDEILKGKFKTKNVKVTVHVSVEIVR